MNWLVPFLFFCSGATALIYEVVWSKYLSLIFGSTIQAQTVVLAVFMGGLALGNWIFGGRGDALKKPLAVYGFVEIAIGIYAAVFHALYSVADGLFVRIGSGFLEQKATLLLIKAVLSGALLLGPTILMGGTLPLLAAWLQRRVKDASRSSTRFYAINTLGALAGAGLAGFVLIQQFGVNSTLFIAAGVNLLIGFIAVILAQNEKSPSTAESPAKNVKVSSAPQTDTSNGKPAILNCAIVCLAGAASMGLEILASRALALIFGSSLQAFAVMLMAFILGIGLGSFAIASLRQPKRLTQGTTVFLFVGAAAVIGIFLLTTEQCALLYLKIRNGSGDQNKYLHHQLVSGVIAILVLGLPAGLIGAVLPLWIRLGSTAGGLAESVGRLLTWNTVGAVIGALFTGFILMPVAGLRLAFGIIGVLLSTGALLVALRNRLPNSIVIAAFSGVIILLVSIVGKENWQYLLSSGIFRVRDKEVSSSFFAEQRERDKLLFYEDGADATVSVVTDRQPRAETEVVLTINGKPDASTLGDLSTQYLLAHLPILMRPASQDVFVLGFGSGVTGGALLGHPLKSLTIAENCQPVLNAASHFSKWNRGVLTNSLAKIYAEDARTVLKLSPKMYDVIISEPSNPWVAGMASVFSQEFYELAASKLKDGGMFSQWFHIYEMNDELVALVLRTFRSVFPSMEIWETRSGDLILLGSRKPWSCSPKVFRQVFARSQPKKDLETIGLKSPEAVLARQLASQETAIFIPGDGPLHSDFRPILDYAAAKAFYEGGAAYAVFVFDERTLQSQFAPVEKREAILSLSDELLVGVFQQYGTANGPLLQYLEWRAQVISFFSRGSEVYERAPFLDLIFRRPESFPKGAKIPDDIAPVYVRLLEAEALIHQPSKWKEGVEIIEKIIQDYNANATEADDGPRFAHFAAIAAKTRFKQGDPAGALGLVNLALNHIPHDIQLHYLKRALTHKQAKTMQPKTQ